MVSYKYSICVSLNYVSILNGVEICGYLQFRTKILEFVLLHVIQNKYFLNVCRLVFNLTLHFLDFWYQEYSVFA